MVVIVTEGVPERLRGFLSRWLLEVRAGVFIGNYNVKVREKLWTTVRDNYGEGNVVMAWDAKEDNGFDFLTVGKNSRNKVNFDGINLVSYLPRMNEG